MIPLQNPESHYDEDYHSHEFYVEDGEERQHVATIEFDALANGTSSFTLRNVNTFAAGGVETGSCNPTVIAAATCLDASVTVSDAVGGIAELPDVVGEALGAPESTFGVNIGLWLLFGAAAIGVTSATGVAVLRRRKR